MNAKNNVLNEFKNDKPRYKHPFHSQICEMGASVDIHNDHAFLQVVGKHTLQYRDPHCWYSLPSPLMNFLRYVTSEIHWVPGLSYWVSGGLLAGIPGGRAGGPVHYALYELGRVL
jgi:hypothetical protein